MVSVSNIFDPTAWFDAIRSVAGQPLTTEKKSAPSPTTGAQDPHALKNVETKGGAALEPKPSEDFLKLKKQVHALERAALLSRNEAQREKYYEKAQKIWKEGLQPIGYNDMFGGSKTKALQENFKTGVGIHKVQAGLWLVDSRYGQMLGSFGFMGMDNKKNYFTDRAIEKFRQDYNAGYIYGVPKPEKPLANAKEAKVEILRLAEARMSEDWTEKSYSYCQQARANLSSSDKEVADQAYSTYFFRCEDFTKEQVADEATQLRHMIEDTSLDEGVRHSAMHLYWKLARNLDKDKGEGNLLPEFELVAGLAMMKRMAADEKTSSLLKGNTDEMIPTLVEKLAPFKATPLDEEEEALMARAFNEKFPGDPLPKFTLADKERYQKVFAELKAASYVWSEFKDKDSTLKNKADEIWEKARGHYYKVCHDLKISTFVQRATIKYFVDDAFASKPVVAAA